MYAHISCHEWRMNVVEDVGPKFGLVINMYECPSRGKGIWDLFIAMASRLPRLLSQLGRDLSVNKRQ